MVARRPSSIRTEGGCVAELIPRGRLRRARPAARGRSRDFAAPPRPCGGPRSRPSPGGRRRSRRRSAPRCRRRARAAAGRAGGSSGPAPTSGWSRATRRRASTALAPPATQSDAWAGLRLDGAAARGGAGAAGAARPRPGRLPRPARWRAACCGTCRCCSSPAIARLRAARAALLCRHRGRGARDRDAGGRRPRGARPSRVARPLPYTMPQRSASCSRAPVAIWAAGSSGSTKT